MLKLMVKLRVSTSLKIRVCVGKFQVSLVGLKSFNPHIPFFKWHAHDDQSRLLFNCLCGGWMALVFTLFCLIQVVSHLNASQLGLAIVEVSVVTWQWILRKWSITTGWLLPTEWHVEAHYIEEFRRLSSLQGNKISHFSSCSQSQIKIQ